jgi:hypothetical protein
MRFTATVRLAALAGAALVLTRHARGTESPSPFATAVQTEMGNAEKLFLAVAEAMPEERFDFSPESLGVKDAAFDGVRTFGQQVKHVAADNFAIWAPLTGKGEPAGLDAPNGPETMKSRA